MKGYPEYKNVNQKWVQNIPKYWDMLRLKLIFALRKEPNNPIITDNILSLTAKQGVIPYTKKIGTGGNRPKSDLTKYNVCRTGDLLVNNMNIVSGAAGVSRYTGAVSPVYYPLVIRNDNNVWYYHYIFRSITFQRSLIGLGKGILMHENDNGTLTSVRMRISMDSLGNVLLPVPPRTEQDQIVRFLDWKISEINKLIGIRKKEIQILEELKKKLTFQILTKGLNKNSVLKDSDNYWIGKIPKHWKVLQIRRLYNVILGKMLSSSKSDSDESLEEYVCAKDVHFGHVNLLNLKKMWFSQNEKKQYQIHSGDLLIVEGGAGAGNAAIVNKMLDKKIYIQNSIHVVRAKDNMASVKFLAYWIESLVARDYMKYICSVATIPHFTKDKVLSTPMPFPPIEEQYQIVNYLDNAYTKIDIDVSSKKTQIETLQELKSSIISDVVTGKIDVRHIPIPEYEHVDDADADTSDDAEREAEERGE